MRLVCDRARALGLPQKNYREGLVQLGTILSLGRDMENYVYRCKYSAMQASSHNLHSSLEWSLTPERAATRTILFFIIRNVYMKPEHAKLSGTVLFFTFHKPRNLPWRFFFKIEILRQKIYVPRICVEIF